jgi:hypothetical protein
MLFTLFRFLTRTSARATAGFCLLALFGLPALAQTPCSELGIHTVNWKSPDSDQTGVLVAQVRDGCVAAGLGIQAGDLITGFNGKSVASQYDLETLAGEFPAGEAFSITLKNAAGENRTIKRDALPIQTVEELPTPVAGTIHGDWLSWFKWAGIFLLVTLFMTPGMWNILKFHKTDIAIGGAAAGAYGEFQKGGREYVGAGVNGALIGLLGVVVFALIGPAGVIYNLYQPFMAMASDTDQKVCCIDNENKLALSQDGRWLAMAKPTPDRFFGLGDKIVRAPYVAAVADLQSGRFVAWKGAVDKYWVGVQSSGDSRLDNVYFDASDRRPYLGWSNGFGTLLAPSDEKVFADPHSTAPEPEARYNMTSDVGGTFVFTETASGKSFTLNPKQPHDKWWLSADGRVLALATRPPQPDEKYDGWLTRTYATLRDLIVGDWSVTFWDVGDQRKLATYKGYGYDEARWKDGRFLDASQDGRRWVMVRDNGFAFVFDLTAKMEPAYAAGRVTGSIYPATSTMTEIAFYREPDTPSPENQELLARLAGQYPFDFLAETPQINDALKAVLGQAYAPLMETLTVASPAEATPDGGLTYTVCKAHACNAGRLVVYISPSLQVSALLFHEDKEISLPETPVDGEMNPDNWSQWVLYEQSSYPQKMAWPLYQAVLADPRGMEAFSIDETRGRISSRFWIVGKRP